MGSKPKAPFRQTFRGARPEPLSVEAVRLRDRLRGQMFQVAISPLRVGRYEVLETIGIGGMGVVYAARDPRLDRRVALKLLHESSKTDRAYRGRLAREARALARLSHPNVVQVFETGWHADQIFVAMEYVEGPTLREWLEATVHPWEDVVEKFVQAGQGLAAAHSCGIVHRDLKPANLMIGGDGRVRVLDFGLARTLGDDAPSDADADDDVGREPAVHRDASLTQTGDIMGTPAYMSPEQVCRKPADARSDQFSYCVALYEALHGQRPFAGGSAAELMLAISEGRRATAATRIKVPRRIERAIDRGLQIDAEQRFPSIEALLAELRPKRGAWIWRAGAVVAVGTAGTLLFMPARGRARCDDLGRELDGIWDSAARKGVLSSFARAPGARGETAARTVAAGLDAYTDRWIEARVRVCDQASQGGRGALTVAAAELACLAQARLAVGALVDRLAARPADAAAVEHAPRATGELPDIAACHRIAPSSATVRPPSAADERGVGHAREQVLRADASAALGQYGAAVGEATQALDAARATGYPPVIAEALLASGRAHGHVLALSTAERQLLEAATLAQEHRHDAVAADAWIELVRVRGRTPARLDDAQAAARHAEASIARLGRDPKRSASLQHRLGYAYMEAEQPHRAREAYRASLDLRSGEPAADPLEVAWTEVMYADAMTADGDLERSLPLFSSAIATISERLGTGHALYAKALVVRGLALVNAGRHDAAAEDLEGALLGYERAYGPDSGRVADVLEAIAELEVRRGGIEPGLVAGERALAIRRTAAGLPGAVTAELSTALGLVAELRHAAGEPLTAISLYREARLTLDGSDPRFGFKQAAFSCNEGLAWVDAGDPSASIPAFERALKGFEGLETPGPAQQCAVALARARRSAVVGTNGSSGASGRPSR